jgi:hypothetical protein
MEDEQLAEFETEITENGLDHREHIRHVLSLIREVRRLRAILTELGIEVVPE